MNPVFSRVFTTIRITVVTAFILATVLTAALAIGLQYYFGQQMARQVAQNLYTTTSSSIAAELEHIGQTNANVIDLLADNPALHDMEDEASHLETFTQVLEKNPLYYGVYVGGDQGTFYEVINLDASEEAQRILRSQPNDRWLIIKVYQKENGAVRHYEYLDANLNVRMSRSESTQYDPRARPWYTSAMESGAIHVTDPYIFAQLGVPGRTVSKRVKVSGAVVAIDMTLSTISEFLREQPAASQGDIYLYSADGQVVASSEKDRYAHPAPPAPKLEFTEEELAFIATTPELRVSNETDWPPIDYTKSGTPEGYSIDFINLIAQMTGLKIRYINGYSWNELIEQFKLGKIDVLHPVVLTEQNREFGLSGQSFADLPYSVATRPDVKPVSDLAQLNGKRIAIPEGWSIIPIVRTRFPGIEIVETKSTLEALEFVLDGQVTAALDNDIIMHYIAHNNFLDSLQFHTDVNFGEGGLPDKLHIVVAKDKPQLRIIIDKAIAAIGEQHHTYLAEKWLSTDAEPAEDTTSGLPSKSLVSIAKDATSHGNMIETTTNGEAYFAYATPLKGAVNNLYMGILSPFDDIVGPFLKQVQLSIGLTGVFLMVLIPISWWFANPIVRPVKQLALENDKVRRREFDSVKRVGTHILELDELSQSMVDMAEAIQAHELAQRELMDSFIYLIAQAIDDKSAYTGGHCKRVPELALMLAKHASRSDLPPFQSFQLTSDDQWREYRIAAWLHDCGKITTPEYIVDKGSKLETIYNRIHEVRMRFEVLWRDAEIQYLKNIMATPEQQLELSDQLQSKHKELLEDFAFVANCNVGGEFLDEEKIDRLHTIAATTWQRHFDDRLGLSPVEELRIPKGEQPSLPATEHLLTDKPEHIIERSQPTEYPPEYRIDMDIPENLYNLGELYNLSVSRGTLTTEDRFKINEHMISTIKMLESLPFPEELKNVPRYASTHHETMKGTGYPRKISGEELSIPERILAVADIFEALTASDRPYKKAKPVSVAIDILHKMVLDDHVDADCFELFIRDKVYIEYAKEFLPESQLDEVDESKYLKG